MPYNRIISRQSLGTAKLIGDKTIQCFVATETSNWKRTPAAAESCSGGFKESLVADQKKIPKNTAEITLRYVYANRE